MTTVSLKNIDKFYGTQQVVHGMNLEIHDGEFIVFVGPSGCGKSTCLRMIAGLEKISRGKIFIGDKIINNLPPRERNISMVFQNYALYPHMTVRDNLGFSLKIAKHAPNRIAKNVAHVAQILELENLLDRRPAELSGGQRQRVAMGRAIVRKPDVFLFDEPLSNLDAKLRTQMRTEIKKLHYRVGNTIIYVTHDQIEAMTLADRIVLMQDGRIVQVGTPLELFNYPVNQFVATFIGSPPMNLLNGIVKSGELVLDNHITLPLPSHTVKSVKNNEQVVFGFRADSLTPVKHGVKTSEETANFDLKVTFIEPLGAETLLFAQIGKVEIQAKMLNPRVVEKGEKLNFQIMLGNCHLFNKETGVAIRD